MCGCFFYHSTPTASQNLWFVYDTQKEIEQLIDCLAEKGIRESWLKKELKVKHTELIKVIAAGKR